MIIERKHDIQVIGDKHYPHHHLPELGTANIEGRGQSLYADGSAGNHVLQRGRPADPSR